MAKIAQRDGRESISIKVLQAFGISNSALLHLCGYDDSNLDVFGRKSKTLVRKESIVDMLESLSAIGFVNMPAEDDSSVDLTKELLHPQVGLEYLKYLWHTDSLRMTAVCLGGTD